MFRLQKNIFMKEKSKKKVKEIIEEYRKSDTVLGSYSGNSTDGSPTQDADDL